MKISFILFWYNEEIDGGLLAFGALIVVSQGFGEQNKTPYMLLFSVEG